MLGGLYLDALSCTCAVNKPIVEMQACLMWGHLFFTLIQVQRRRSRSERANKLGSHPRLVCYLPGFSLHFLY